MALISTKLSKYIWYKRTIVNPPVSAGMTPNDGHLT